MTDVAAVVLTPGEVHGLIEAAKGVLASGYAPYSGFRVGAALLAESGEVYTGCNVENASFGATICAERSAVCSAVAHGERRFRAIAVVSDGPELCSPCGICRQVIAEFGPETVVIRANPAGESDLQVISFWLPGAFTGADLGLGGSGHGKT